MDEHEISQQETPPRALARLVPQGIQKEEFLDVSPEEVPHLLDYWRTIFKRRWAVLFCLLVIFTTVAIGTLKQKPIYQGTVLIEINPEQPNVLNFKEVLQIDTTDADTYRETQYKVLESRTLAERVITDLKLYQVPEFYRKRRLFGLLESDPQKGPSTSGSGPPDTSSDVFQDSVKHFMDSVEITPVRRSNLVEVSYSAEDPRLAARVANKLADAYIDQSLQVRWDEAQKASDWLQGQLVELKGKLEKSDDLLQKYAEANSILFVEEKKNLGNARLEQLQEAFTKVQADRFQKEAMYNQVQAGRVQDLPGFLSNRLIQDLAEKLSELQRDYSQLTATVKPDYPRALALKKQIDTVQASLDHHKKALAENIVDEYRSAVANEKYLADALEQAKKDVNDIAEKSIQYNILKREVDTNKQLYEGLLQRQKEAVVSAASRASSIRVVDAAEVPKVPVRPRVLMNLALGLVLGFGLGVGLALLQEYMDDTLKGPDEVENLLRLPSLGSLPLYTANGGGASQSLVPAEGQARPGSTGIDTNSTTLEAFRSLRTSILLSANPVPKMLLVTSALPSEGKTTTTVNLGVTLASLGSKVVIVDCDMRRPSCHRATGVENKPGFVQCLTGHVQLPQAILPVPGVENLSVIPCGPIPPNPAEILTSPVTAEMLQKLRADFEYVLVDSPPLLSVSDSRILSTITDAVVIVARAHDTPYGAVRRARDLLYGAGARVLGVALNAIDVRAGGYYSYDYYYRYGYRYGYGGYGYGYGYGSRPEDRSSKESEEQQKR